MNRRAIGLAVLVLTAGSLAAQTADDAFQRANTAYREGRFEEASRDYQSILRQGMGSAAVYYNLGNAYYRMGKIGLSILAYERALRLEPGDPDTEQNLRLANFRAVDRIEAVPEFFLISWIRALSTLLPFRLTTILFLAFWTILFLCFASVYLVLPASVKRFARWMAVVSSAAVVLFGLVLIVHVVEGGGRDEAIILSVVVTAKNSPDAQSTDAFVIHEGLKVRLSDAVGEWTRITLADGKVGWVPSASVERI